MPDGERASLVVTADDGHVDARPGTSASVESVVHPDMHTRLEPVVSASGQIDPQEHEEWSQKMWNRMDRDRSGSITREELDCEEFRSVLKAVLNPVAGGNTGGAGYQRTQMNIAQALSFCLRKADINSDGRLGFSEFKSFLLYLRNSSLSKHTCNLIFALFDLDGSQTIDKQEFREVYRFYLGHNPLHREFEDEWLRAQGGGATGTITRVQYVRWLQTSKNPLFNVHAPPIEADGSHAHGALANRPKPRSAKELIRARPAYSTKERPIWNTFFNTQRNANQELPQNRRNYFMRPQSLPELKSYADVHRGCGRLRSILDTNERFEVPKRVSAVLSTESSPNPAFGLPSRHLPNGYAGAPLWEEHWCTPAAVLATRRFSPGTHSLRCLGEPPSFLLSRSCVRGDE